MATYAELKELSQHMDRIDDSVFMGFDIEGMPNHLPRNVRRANDAFVAANKDIPGVMDYDTSGFTEPEDEHDCFINNQALTRLPEVMPYLEKMNQYVKEGGLEDDKYSMYTLHLGAKILNGKDKGLSDEQVDYLCEVAGKKDLGYFGSYRYSVENVRGMMREGESLSRIKMLESMKEENEQAVNFYRDFCDETYLPKNDEALILIGSSANMGVAYGLQEAMTDKCVSLNDAKAISECMDKICEAARDPKFNIKYESTVEYDDGTSSTYTNSRFATFAMEHYVEDIVENLYDKGSFRNHPESLKTMVNDFINDAEVDSATGVPKNQCISRYYDDHKEKYDKILESEKVEEKDFYISGVERTFAGPWRTVELSMFDNKPFVHEETRRLGRKFDITLSDELADKLGIYHDDEFKAKIQYEMAFGEKELSNVYPDINVCTGVKRVDDIEYSVGAKTGPNSWDITETITGSHMEHEMTPLDDTNGMFTKSQVNELQRIVNDAISADYPGFAVDPHVGERAVLAPEKLSKDRTKTAEAEFGDIQSGTEASIDSPNFK